MTGVSQSSRKSVSLVLGSGGARGLAHIGVIRHLEENDYDIRSIAGCSMGAVIGGIYAAGKLDEYEKWVCAIDRVDIVSLLDFSWQKDGLVKGEKIIATLKGLIGEYDIQDLPIRFTAVATDFRAEKEVWIQKGSLFDAIRASMSLPLFFTPFEYKGRRLIDGGVLNPVPIAPTFSDDNDLTIAVNLSGRIDTQSRPPKIGDLSDYDDEDVPILRRRIARFLDSLGDRRAKTADRDELHVLEIANLAFDAMQGAISRQKLAAYPPDKVITIPSNVASVLEFDRARELIEVGYDAAGRQLENESAGTGL